MATGRCDLPCLGDPGLFCGGELDTFSISGSRFRSRQRVNRRDAPADILLTLYAQIEAISGSLTASDVLSAVDATTDNISKSTAVPTIPTSQSFVDSVITIESSVPVTKTQGGRPIIPPFKNPSRLTVTEFCATLRSPPCRHCQYQRPPTVPMTTIKAGHPLINDSTLVP